MLRKRSDVGVILRERRNVFSAEGCGQTGAERWTVASSVSLRLSPDLQPAADRVRKTLKTSGCAPESLGVLPDLILIIRDSAADALGSIGSWPLLRCFQVGGHISEHSAIDRCGADCRMISARP